MSTVCCIHTPKKASSMNQKAVLLGRGLYPILLVKLMTNDYRIYSLRTLLRLG